jgi:hypothetical protein
MSGECVNSQDFYNRVVSQVVGLFVGLFVGYLKSQHVTLWKQEESSAATKTLLP